MESFAEARKARDDDFEELMNACNIAKEASKNGHSLGEKSESSSNAMELNESTPIANLVSQTAAPPKAAPVETPLVRVPTSSPKALDNLQDSVESDPVTVVEKDDNGFVYYKCRFCGLTFNYMNTLRAHERVHAVSQPYVCGKCGEAFDFSCQLEYHTSQHSTSNGYKCECGRSFFSYTEMLYHKHPEDIQAEREEKLHGAPLMVGPSTSSNGPTMQDMPVPDFAEKGYEPKHPMKVYNDVRSKPYICEYCSKSYSDSRQLAYHMYSHRGEKMFNPRSSRYLMGRQGVGYTDRSSYDLLPRSTSYSYMSTY